MKHLQENKTNNLDAFYLAFIGLINIAIGIYFYGLQNSNFNAYLIITAAGAAFISGMIFLISANQPLKYWRLTFAGLLVQLSLAILLIVVFIFKESAILYAVFIALNTLLLYFPVVKIIYRGYSNTQNLLDQLNYMYTSRASIEALLVKTNRGENLFNISKNKPTLLVFLRHFGCTFCREALATLAKEKEKINALGTEITIVHMGTEKDASTFLKRYGLENVHRISDPELKLYTMFSIEKGNYNQLFGLKVLLRATLGGVLFKNLQGKLSGDYKQLSGVFLLHQGKIKKAYRHYTAADQPNFTRLAECDTCI